MTNEDNPREDPKGLLARAKEGDELAYGKLYEAYYTPIYRYLFFRLKNKEETEDLTQTVFLKVYEALDHMEYGNQEPIAYFYTVARNTLIDHHRKQKVRNNVDESHLLNDIADEHPGREYTLDIEFANDKITGALSSLTPEQSEVLTLKFVQELSNKEIAKHLGKKEDAIRQLQSRALRALRENLENMEDTTL